MASREKEASLDSYVERYFLYDPDTGILCRKEQPNPWAKLNKPLGSPNQFGYLTFSRKFEGKTQSMYVHRIVWRLYYGKWPDKEIDHIDNDRTNNRIDNLREATRTQNNCNRVAREQKTSKYLGVSYYKANKKWHSQINYLGKKVHLGYYTDEVDAAKAYDQAALKYHKNFAKINGV